jgi:putative IMPACT (imprinted ancient) family translation regulator
VPAAEGRGQLRERASRFLAFAVACTTPEEASERVAAFAREHHDATHVAFAWTVGAGDAARARSSDAGEPSGTAGKPIAAAIAAAGLSDVLVAVVRHFGGTKLGTGGLARAYREAAARALASAGARVVYETATLEVTCPPARVSAVKRLVRPPDVSIVAEEFAADALLTLSVRKSLFPALTARLDAERIRWRLSPGT